MKSVCICGSRRFTKDIRKFSKDLKKLEVVVFEPHLHRGKDEWTKFSNSYKTYTAMGLTHDHFQKIRTADVVYIFNKGGYSGVSVTMELAYAIAFAKPVYVYSDNDEELCRKVLFKEVIKTPKELIKKLK